MTFNSATEKRQYVHNMFSRIVHRYDMMNRVMTAGQDRAWRRFLIAQAQLPAQGRLLDLATGTGDIALEVLRDGPPLHQIVGADFTLPMLQVAQQREQKLGAAQKPIIWSGADALSLPFAENTFDAVANGFLMRNVVDINQALREQYRVCKPGGRVLILEIPRPPDTLLGNLFRFYFYRIVPIIGGLISGQHDAYNYLPASADAFLRPDELKAAMAAVGLKDIRYTMLMFNTVALHVGVK